jgi:hypothetical protein
VSLDEEVSEFSPKSTFDHPYPTTKIMWIPDSVCVVYFTHRPYTNRRDIRSGCGWVVRSFLTLIVRGVSIDKMHGYNDCTIPWFLCACAVYMYYLDQRPHMLTLENYYHVPSISIRFMIVPWMLFFFFIVIDKFLIILILHFRKEYFQTY